MPKRTMAEMEAICTRYLPHHKANYQDMHAVLQDILDAVPQDKRRDFYGEGELIEQFEADIAANLGKESAVFMPTGTMTQQILLRIVADRSGNRKVVFHPTCHLEIHEQKAYQHLHHLHGIPVGDAHHLIKPEHVFAVKERFRSLLLELPQREIGGQLPSWEELVQITQWAKSEGIHVHMDGARLWQCTPFYQRNLAEIAGLFDTVYVSFYKILGGLSGAALCGSKELMDEARLWRHRHGGKLFQVYPMILSAQLGMKQHLPRIPAYVEKTHAIAEVLSQIPGITVNPNPPHINMMHLFIEGDRERLEHAAWVIAEEDQVFLFHTLRETQLPEIQKLELTIGDAAFDISDEEVGALFEKLIVLTNGA